MSTAAGRRDLAFPPIRSLGPGDQSRCVALSVDRGWSPERAKWGLLLAACEVFGIDAPDGRGLAGAVVLTRWGADYACVGMMLVAARYGRRGLGRALMEHLLRAAGDDATVTLFATDLGRPLYEKLGFAAVRRNVAFTGQFRLSPDPDNSKKHGVPGIVRAATEADLPAILALDRAAFGADRGRILTRLPAFAERIAVFEAAEPAGQGAETAVQGIAGYAAAWRNEPTSAVIGPVVAPDAAAARRLVTELAVHARTSVRIDLDPDRRELPGWADAHGLAPTSRNAIMARGPLVSRGTPERLFAPISVALA